MKPIWKFRLLVAALLISVGYGALTNLTSELWRPAPTAFPAKNRDVPSEGRVNTAGWAAAVAPFRTDLKADFASALATRALRNDAGFQPAINQDAQSATRAALQAGPHDSRIWLLLALLKMQRSVHDPMVMEALKMSYFTGANSLDLVPTRLTAVIETDAINDPDLKELARGDVRLILTRRPELKLTLSDSYRRAAAPARSFIEESIRAIDPKFAASFLK